VADVNITFEGETAEVEGETEEGVRFIDGYFPNGEYQVIDEGRIRVEVSEVENLTALAKAEGLFIRTSE
jgi:hypothetical protein